LVASFGAGAVFLLNAVSFLGVIVVLFRWRRPKEKSNLPPRVRQQISTDTLVILELH